MLQSLNSCRAVGSAASCSGKANQQPWTLPRSATASGGPRTGSAFGRESLQTSGSILRLGPGRRAHADGLFLGGQSLRQTEGRRVRRGAVRTAAMFKTFEAKRVLTMTAPPENPQFPMESYLQDTTSIVQMSFPDGKRRSQVAPDKWRVQLLPIQFLWTTIRVSCTVRAWGDGKQLLISGRELWIDGMPPELGRADSVKLAVDGLLKAQPLKNRNVDLHGSVRLAISADIPDILALSPGLDPIVVGILDSILGRLQESISRGIIADYDQWQRKRAREAAAAPAGRNV